MSKLLQVTINVNGKLDAFYTLSQESLDEIYMELESLSDEDTEANL